MRWDLEFKCHSQKDGACGSGVERRGPCVTFLRRKEQIVLYEQFSLDWCVAPPPRSSSLILSYQLFVPSLMPQ